MAIMLRSAIFIAIICATPAVAKDLPPLADLAKQTWTTIEPGGDTVCADGSPYSFNVKPGSPEKLLLFFHGGGACWSAETCDPSAERPVYVSKASSPNNDPREKGGIFNAARSDNPFRDWSVVSVSYCTGDSHVGARRVTYKAGPQSFAIEHKGYLNATAVLGWAFRNYPSPKSVLVTGSSAGAIAAPFYVGTVATQYPAARISVLGDAAGAYRSEAIPVIFRDWGVEDIAPNWIRARGALPLNIETFFKVNAKVFPQLPQAQHNNAADAVQGVFLKLLGETSDVESHLRANLDELRRDAVGFRSYTAPGTDHTVLLREEFYAYAVEGAPLSRWVADFAEGKPVPDIDCARDAAGCGTPHK